MPSPAGPIAQRLEQPRTPSGLVAGANPRIGLPFAGDFLQHTITSRAHSSAVRAAPNAFRVGRMSESSNCLLLFMTFLAAYHHQHCPYLIGSSSPVCLK